MQLKAFYNLKNRCKCVKKKKKQKENIKYF